MQTVNSTLESYDIDTIKSELLGKLIYSILLVGLEGLEPSTNGL